MPNLFSAVPTVNQRIQPLLQQIEQRLLELCAQGATLEQKLAFISAIASVNHQGVMSYPKGLRNEIDDIRANSVQIFNQAKASERARLAEIQQQFVATLIVKSDIVQTPYFQEKMRLGGYSNDDNIDWPAIMPVALACGLLNGADDMVDNMLWNMLIFGRPSPFHPLTLYLFGARPGNLGAMDRANSKALGYLALGVVGLYAVLVSGSTLYASGKHMLNIKRGKDIRENTAGLVGMTLGAGAGVAMALPSFSAIAASTLLATEVGLAFPPILGAVVAVAIVGTAALLMGWLASGLARKIRMLKQTRDLNKNYSDPHARDDAQQLLFGLENAKNQTKVWAEQRELQKDINALCRGDLRYYSINGHIIELKPNRQQQRWPYQQGDQLGGYASYHDINHGLFGGRPAANLYPPVNPVAHDDWDYGYNGQPLRQPNNPPPINPELYQNNANALPPAYAEVEPSAPAAYNERAFLLTPNQRKGYGT